MTGADAGLCDNNKIDTGPSASSTGACHKHARNLCVACALQTAIFPVEHYIWARFLGPIFGISL